MNTGSQTLDLLIRLIGEEPAFGLVRECGGTRIKFVRGLTRSSLIVRERVAEIIGERGYEVLLQHFGTGQALDVPMAANLLRQRDIAKAIQLMDEGLETNEIALILKHTSRWVERVTKTVPNTKQVEQAESIQSSLF